MKWEEEVNGKWEERDIVNAYSIAMKKSENGEKLTEDDILKIQNYRKLNPHRPLSKNTVEALNEERYNWTDIPETVFSKITDPSEWSWGTLGQALEGSMISQSNKEKTLDESMVPNCSQETL